MGKIKLHRRRIRITLTLGVLSAVLIAGTAVALATPDRAWGDKAQAQRLREIEQTRLRALVDANIPVVERLHADDFRLIPPPGFPLSRDEYIAAVAAGDLDYLVFEPVSDIEVRLYGNAAVLIYQSHIDIVAGGEARLEHDAWHTYVYEKRHGRWQAVWEQATAVGGFPPPSE